MKKISLAAATFLFVATAISQNPTAPAAPVAPASPAERSTIIVIDDGGVSINGKPVEKSDHKRTIVVSKNGAMTINGENVTQTDAALHLRAFRMDKNAYLGVASNANDEAGELSIAYVDENSPAAKAGLKEGDIITKIDGKEVKDFAELNAIVRAKKAGDEVNIDYTRNGKKQKTTAKLITRTPFASPGSIAPRIVMGHPIERPENFNFSFDEFQGQFFRFGQPKYGMQVEDRAEGDGVKVVGLTAGSNADKAGLKEGDIIVSIDKNPVADITALMEKLGEETEGKAKTFQITRDGKQMELSVLIPKQIRSANL